MNGEILNLLPPQLQGKEGVVALSQVTETKLIALYFSAHWCPPCRMFTPQLAELYKKVNKDGKKIEVIFVSSDQSQDDFNSYYGSMPWLAVQFDSESREMLGEALEVNGIPSLFVFSNTGKLIDRNARQTITNSGEGAIQTWLSKV